MEAVLKTKANERSRSCPQQSSLVYLYRKLRDHSDLVKPASSALSIHSIGAPTNDAGSVSRFSPR